MLKVAYHHSYAAKLPKGHRFPMLKYELIPEQLIYQGVIFESNLFAPEMMSEENILKTHEKEYFEHLKNQTLDKKGVRKLGLPLTQEMFERECRIMQGTFENALFALKYGVSFNVAGGTHHSYTNRGEGFCLLNDIGIASNLLLEKGIKKILVVDLDVHQGNGTAEIFQNEERVFTFSMHGEKNYPLKKEVSNLDIALPDGTNDQHYIKELDYNLKRLIDREEPEFIFYQSGVDPLETDKLGRLSLTIEGLKSRDDIVFNTCKSNNIPVAVSMGGGYSPDIRTIVDAHCNTFISALEILM